MEPTAKYVLDDNEIPKNFYNVLPDLPRPLDPPLNPGTMKPISPADLEPVFPKELIRQEASSERFIAIPQEVREAFAHANRPSPLFRAYRLEQYLKTPAKIFFKHEGLNPCGAHKINTAIAQAYYASKEGIESFSTETGAGQWGTALAYSSALFGLTTRVFMVRVSFDQKPFRKTMMEMYGAKVFASPSTQTAFGKKVLAEHPNHTGSLGIAISEALQDCVGVENARYAIGSVLNFVLLHQTVIGQEVEKQLAMAEIEPDVAIGCVGGGSNFGGFMLPLYYRKKKKNLQTRFVAVEPSAAPSITKGKYEYDFGDTAGLTPMLKMHTLGRDFIPSPIHAGGLRYHGMAPIISLLADCGEIETVAVNQHEVFEAAQVFAKVEGIIPAPESAHAIKAAIDEALACKRSGEEKNIVFNLSGHGLLDLGGYREFLDGKI